MSSFCKMHTIGVRSAVLYLAAMMMAGTVLGAGTSMTITTWRHYVFSPSKQKFIKGDGAHHGPEGMMWIPGGEFVVGSSDRLAKPYERPAHKVRVQHTTVNRWSTLAPRSRSGDPFIRMPDCFGIRAQGPGIGVAVESSEREGAARNCSGSDLFR